MKTETDLSAARLYLDHVHCPDCVRDLISDVVLKVDGVAAADFNPKDLSLIVSFDSGKADEQKVRDAVKAVGYEFREPGDNEPHESVFANRLLLTLAVLAVLLLIFWTRSI